MVPRKVGTAWEILAPAKVNLYLEVLGRRTDGFHELETLMVPVSLYDQLHWTPSTDGEVSDFSFSVDGSSNSGHLSSLGNQNLVPKAAQLLAARAGIKAHGHFHLTKRIPLAAGLGGGSSDAAAALLLANEAWQAGASRVELASLAAELGSDVPFFLTPGPAICRGRGEIVESVTGLPKLHLVVVKPKLGLSTQSVFSRLKDITQDVASSRNHSAQCLGRLLQDLKRGAIGRAGRSMVNRLEDAASQMTLEIRLIKDTLSRAGCWGQLMTGSGSAVLGIARSAWHARQIAGRLTAQSFGTVLATASG